MAVRKKYSKKFKLDAVSLVLEQGYGCSEAAKSLGIQPLLSRWIKEHQEPDRHAFRGNGKLSAEQAEIIRRLKEENKRLKMEKEILKNAMVFFTQETK